MESEAVTHKIKILPCYYQRVKNQTKNFEVRWNDRDYQVGDFCEIKEWDPETQRHTDSTPLIVRINYVLHGGGDMGIEFGYCVFGFELYYT